MRIAIACRRVDGVTGTTTTILEHSRRLAALGWEVHVYGERLDRGRLAAVGARAHALPRWLWGSRLKRRIFAGLFDLSLKGERFDLVWGHGDTLSQDVLSLHNCVHAAYEAVHAGPLPESSGDGWFHGRLLEDRGFRLLIANSDLMRRDLLHRWALPEDMVRVIRPGHDPVRFRPGRRAELGDPLRRSLGISPDEVLVGLITSGDFTKRGVALFLKALGRLSPDARSRMRALVVGQEIRLSPYRKLASEAGLADKVIFLPPKTAVERLYHALDVYVHPALYEEFGQSVQEALACGIPVLTSARTGAAELLSGESREMLLEEPTEEGVAGMLERLILDAEMRKRWATEGPAACRGNTWDDNFKATLSCLKELL